MDVKAGQWKRLSTKELTFELWCWRRVLRVPWTVRRSNQSILKEINPEYSLEGLMLKLKLQYFGHLIGRADSLEKTLRLGKNKGRRRGATEDEMLGWHHQLKGHESEQTLKHGEGQGSLVCCSPRGCRVRLGNWTTTNTEREAISKSRNPHKGLLYFQSKKCIF